MLSEYGSINVNIQHIGVRESENRFLETGYLFDTAHVRDPSNNVSHGLVDSWSDKANGALPEFVVNFAFH